MKATVEFRVTGWKEEPWDLTAAGEGGGEADAGGVDGGSSRADAAEGSGTPEPGPHLSAARVTKEYSGELEGTGRARLLMCRASLEGPLRNAGYIVSERVVGRLAGRAGSFVLHHWGVAPEGSPPWTAGHVVPGSGTGELAGLTGTMEIRVDGEGTHTLLLEYEL